MHYTLSRQQSPRLSANLSDTASDQQSVAGFGAYAGSAPLNPPLVADNNYCRRHKKSRRRHLAQL